eukprot:scaffold132586_cov66-Phaeocystis_antarctica.AAC.1
MRLGNETTVAFSINLNEAASVALPSRTRDSVNGIAHAVTRSSKLQNGAFGSAGLALGMALLVDLVTARKGVTVLPVHNGVTIIG